MNGQGNDRWSGSENGQKDVANGRCRRARTAGLYCPDMLPGWFHVTSALLVISGGAKIFDAAATAGALRAARLPSAPILVRALGLVEIVVGSAGLLFGRAATFGLQASFYAGFAGFVLMALVRRLPIQSCGCFGRSDTPPTWIHFAVNITAMAVALPIGAEVGPVWDTIADRPGYGLAYLGYVALGTYLLTIVLTQLPSTLRLAHR